jgi:hypothetical protein
MFSRFALNRTRTPSGRSFCPRGHPNEHPSGPKDAKGPKMVSNWVSFSALLLLFFCPGCPMGSRRVPERPPAPKNYKKTAKQELLDTDIVSQNDQRDERIAFKLSIPSVKKTLKNCRKQAEQPKRKELQRTMHPK